MVPPAVTLAAVVLCCALVVDRLLAIRIPGITRLPFLDRSSASGEGRRIIPSGSSVVPVSCYGPLRSSYSPCHLFFSPLWRPGISTSSWHRSFSNAALRGARSRNIHSPSVAALNEGVETGREKVRLLVSRDTADLDRVLVLSAGYESMTENLTDSIISPLFWFSLFGLAGAAACRAINTMLESSRLIFQYLSHQSLPSPSMAP